jgi:hypothetical protein
MVINFRTRGISRGARKLTRTPTLIQKKKQHYQNIIIEHILMTLKRSEVSVCSLYDEI